MRKFLPFWTVFLCVFFVAGPFSPASGKTERIIPSHVGDMVVLADSEYHPTLLSLIRNARSSIDIAMFLFKTGKRGAPAEIINELGKAAKRGVKVTVILEKSGYDQKLNNVNQKTARLLEKKHVTVLFDSEKRTSHIKLVVVDRRLCLVGSHNFTQAALRYNHELSLLVNSPPLASELLKYMAALSP